MLTPSQNNVLRMTIVLAAVLLAYSNHFNNDFHFDDSHAVVNNPYIRDLSNLGVILTDARAFSVLPVNRGYRPIVSASLAVDYWLGGGLKPFYFHLTTFVWFLVQLVIMFVLFRMLCEDDTVALIATAAYGLHPAMAETVNYVIQRGDVFSTLGVVAGIAVYARVPAARRFGVYLIPVVLAILSKPPALIFPALLFLYVRLFEDASTMTSVKKCVPAAVVVALAGYLNVALTPSTFTGGASSALNYRIIQPYVAARYFRSFFLPFYLSADSDLSPPSGWSDPNVILGFVFVIALVAVPCGCRCAKIGGPQPLAYGGSCSD